MYFIDKLNGIFNIFQVYWVSIKVDMIFENVRFFIIFEAENICLDNFKGCNSFQKLTNQKKI